MKGKAGSLVAGRGERLKNEGEGEERPDILRYPGPWFDIRVISRGSLKKGSKGEGYHPPISANATTARIPRNIGKESL